MQFKGNHCNLTNFSMLTALPGELHERCDYNGNRKASIEYTHTNSLFQIDEDECTHVVSTECRLYVNIVHSQKNRVNSNSGDPTLRRAT